MNRNANPCALTQPARVLYACCQKLLCLAACVSFACVPDVRIGSDEKDGGPPSTDAGTDANTDDDSTSGDAGESSTDDGSHSDDSTANPGTDSDGTTDDEAMTDDVAATDTSEEDTTDESEATDGDGDDAGTTDPVQSTLDALNVDTEASPRVDENGDPLPESYTPLRSRKTLRQRSELLLTGVAFDAAEQTVNLLQFRRENPDGSGAMAKLPESPLPSDWQSSPVSATAAGDLDGDGFDEAVFLWWDAVQAELRLQTVDDLDGGFAASAVDTLGSANPSELHLIAADVYGTGSDSLVIGVVEGETVMLTILQGNAADGYSRLGGPALEFAATDAGELSLELAAGQLDRDGALELVVVTNETWSGGRNSSPGSGVSAYTILDDANAALEVLASELVSTRVDNASVDALKGTVALGDLDGDSLDEILLAGLTTFPVECEPVEAMHLVLDDAAGDFEELGAATSSVPVSPGCEVSGNGGWTSHLWAGMLNIDTDEARELHINGKVFDDFLNTQPFTPMELDGTVFEIPGADMFRGSNNGRPRIGRRNARLIVGDVTDDGFEDIIVYTPTTERLGDDETQSHHLRIWGFDPRTGNWGLKHAETLAGFPETDNNEDSTPPVGLVALNVDADSTVVKYTGTHRVIFTEPVVHAALAAPPCWDDGTQDTDTCRTSWGKGASAGADASISHEISARKHMGWQGGVDIPFVGEIGVEFEETVGVSLANEASLGYELTTTITYQTGAMEDTVVATVVPYDQYVYTLVAHSEYPELVGQEIVVSLPRRPRTIQVEREFFNRALGSAGPPIDSGVFSHEIGNPQSYPSESDARNQSSLRVGPVEVGASTGNTDVEISETVSAGFSTALSVSYEATLKATSGAYMTGFSIGESLTASLGVSVGSTTTFAGSVGDIQPDAFTPDKAYGYGMFVYLDELAGQDRPFQVINYWVE